jgi:hypothetical protein
MEDSLGLFDFTTQVLKALGQELQPLRIDAHEDAEEADFLFYSLTPELSLSEGEYMKISMESGQYWVEFGTRACCGGDPTWAELPAVDLTSENAQRVAELFKNELLEANEKP